MVDRCGLPIVAWHERPRPPYRDGIARAPIIGTMRVMGPPPAERRSRHRAPYGAVKPFDLAVAPFPPAESVALY